MPFITTTLNKNSTYNLEVTLFSGSVAVTVLTCKTNGAIAVESLLSPNSVHAAPGNGVARLVFITNAPAGTTGTFRVLQAGQTLCDLVIGGSAPVDLTVTFTVA